MSSKRGRIAPTSRTVDVRIETPADIDAIRRINDEAFGQFQEGRIIDALRDQGGVLLSLVATANARLVGHVLFSPASVTHDGNELAGVALGPMAVLPQYQRQTIGTRLIETGIESLRKMDCAFIVVVGHPQYYPRFGFEPASRLGLHCEWKVPDNAFMVLVLDAARMKGVSGTVRYRPEFASLG